jgi:protease I
MPATIEGKRVAFLATDGVEQVELDRPWEAITQAGGRPELVSLQGGEIQGFDHLDKADRRKVDKTLDQASADDYDALVLPGGQINPDLLRVNANAIELIRAFFDKKKIVAAICHAPWLLIEAGVIKGRKVTSYHSIKTDVINAGGKWENAAVVTDQGLITSRNPGDLDAFCKKIVEEVMEGPHTKRHAAA